MLKNIKSEVKKQLKAENINTTNLKRDITIKLNELDEEAKNLFRGYMRGKCDEKMYNELKTEIEMEKEKLQKDMDKYLEIDAETDEILANIAEIAANVGKFLKSPIISEKRDILKLILSDCKTEGKNIAFSIVKPFNELLKTPETDKWCRWQECKFPLLKSNGSLSRRKVQTSCFTKLFAKFNTRFHRLSAPDVASQVCPRPITIKKALRKGRLF